MDLLKIIRKPKKLCDKTSQEFSRDEQSSPNSYRTTPILTDSITIKNKKHLICDDAPSNRLVLKKYLIMFGCEVDEAENGLDAINKVKANGIYDIIWMDIKMPIMDGFGCTHTLISKMKYTGTIIGLTGYVDEITVTKCYDLGMTHVLSKPFDKKVIKNYCEKYQSQEEPQIIT